MWLKGGYVFAVALLLMFACVSSIPIRDSFASAASVNAPSGTVAYVPVTITNFQSAPTPAPFQQMVTVNSASYSTYEAPNLQNVEFFNANGTVIPSWLESGNSNTASDTVYWLKLANGIQPGSSITVYMGFASLSTSLFNAQTTGEAPQLSSVYGEYDNGQNAFLAYYNMNRNPVTSALSGLDHYSIATSSGPLGGTQSLLVWTGTAPGNELDSIKASQFPASFVITAWIQTDSYPWDIGLGSTSSNSLYNGYSADPGAYDNSGFDIWRTSGNVWDYPVIGSMPYSMIPNSWYTLQYSYVNGGDITGTIESYQNTLTVPSTAEHSSAHDSSYNTFDSILLAPYSLNSAYVTRWALIVARSYPPNGIMPVASLGSPLVVTDFTISIGPLSMQSITAGESATATVTLNSIHRFTGNVTLSTGVSPSQGSVTASVNPSTVTLQAGGSASSTLTIASTNNAQGAAYTVTVTGTSASQSNSTSVTIIVIPGSLAVSASPSALSIFIGSLGQSTITLNSLNGFSGMVAFSWMVSPAGPQPSFNPPSVSLVAGGTGTSQLTISVPAGTLAGSYLVTVTGSSGMASASTKLTVTVPPPDFSVVASPASLTIGQGSTGVSTITVNSVNGFTGTVGLMESALPTIGLNCSLSASSITLGVSGSSTLSCNGTPGSYTVTVTGTSGPASHSTTILTTVPVGDSRIFGISLPVFYGSLGGGVALVVILAALAVLRVGNGKKKKRQGQPYEHAETRPS